MRVGMQHQGLVGHGVCGGELGDEHGGMRPIMTRLSWRWSISQKSYCIVRNGRDPGTEAGDVGQGGVVVRNDLLRTDGRIAC